MRISRLYYSGPLVVETVVTLPAQTSHYLLRVLRYKVGAGLLLFNGAGGQYKAKLLTITQKLAVVSIEEYQQPNVESPLYSHLAQALCRTEKMDWLLQKAVELGVSQITPIISQFSSVNLTTERLANRLAHWQKIIISACEQSGRTQLPILSAPCSYLNFIQQPYVGNKIFCHPKATIGFTSLPDAKSVVIVIGPEGGLSLEELEQAQQANFTAISLGPRILRTETAALTALTLAQYCWGNLNFTSKAL